MQTENKYNSFLITNARRGYFNDVRKALDNGADVNVVDDEGNTALICSTMLGLDETINDDENEDYLEVIKLLLLHNVDISKQNNEKYTAMSFACIYNNPKMVKLLLERWVWLSDHNIHMDMCKKDNDIKTGIVFACVYGHLEIMKILLKSNIINVNTAMYGKNEEVFPYCDDFFLDVAMYEPLLITACSRKHINIISYLLNLPNIDVNVRDTFNKTSLMLSCERGDIEVVKLLLSHPNIDIYKPNKRYSYRIAPTWTFNPTTPNAPTAISYAWDHDHLKIIELLDNYIQNKKKDVMYVVYKGQTIDNNPLLPVSKNDINKIITSYVI